MSGSASLSVPPEPSSAITWRTEAPTESPATATVGRSESLLLARRQLVAVAVRSERRPQLGRQHAHEVARPRVEDPAADHRPVAVVARRPDRRQLGDLPSEEIGRLPDATGGTQRGQRRTIGAPRSIEDDGTAGPRLPGSRHDRPVSGRRRPHARHLLLPPRSVSGHSRGPLSPASTPTTLSSLRRAALGCALFHDLSGC